MFSVALEPGRATRLEGGLLTATAVEAKLRLRRILKVRSATACFELSLLELVSGVLAESLLCPTREALESCTASTVHVIAVVKVELIGLLVAAAVVEGELIPAHPTLAWRHEPLRG